MNMIAFTYVLLGFLVNAPAYLDQAAKQEVAAPQTGVRDEVIMTVRLNHTEAPTLAMTLRELTVLPVNLMPVGNDRLVVSGTAAAVQTVVEKYVPAIDVPGTGESATTAAFLKVQHYPIDELMGLVHTVAPKGRVGLDELNRTLVVNATEPAVIAVRELLKQIDRPAQSVTLQFYFLRAAKPGDAKTETLPPALQPIGQALAENGFAQPVLMAPIIVMAQEGEKFESRSVFSPAATGGGSEMLEFFVDGSVRLQSAGEVAQLALRARMGGVIRLADAHLEPAFELHTSLAMKVGQYVILGAAPSSTARGDGVALVVRAEPSPKAPK